MCVSALCVCVLCVATYQLCVGRAYAGSQFEIHIVLAGIAGRQQQEADNQTASGFGKQKEELWCSASFLLTV